MPEEPPKAPYPSAALTPDQIQAKLARYRSILPSAIIDDLFRQLKLTQLPEAKVDEIIDRAANAFSNGDSGAHVDELVTKINSLEATLIDALKAIESRQESMRSETARRSIGESEKSDGHGPEAEPPSPLQLSGIRKYPLEQEQASAPLPDPEPAPELAEDEIPEDFTRREKVLLADIREEAINNAIVLKWVEFLIETVGQQNLPEVLDYYVDIGWISERVVMKLLAYANGMVAPRGRAKEKMSVKDHLRSLLFIEKLKGKDLDHTRISRLEREIEYSIEKKIR